MNDNFYSQSSKRLREERNRLGLNQAVCADLCGVSREMWGKYERGLAAPGGEVLFSFAANGADVNYILTGRRATAIEPIDKTVQIAVELLNAMDKKQRALALSLLLSEEQQEVERKVG